jgi:hypothetical protein
VQWVRREAQGGRAETEVRQTRCGAGREEGRKEGSSVGGEGSRRERVASEVKEGERRGSYTRRRKAAPGRREGALPEPAAPNRNRRTPYPTRPR